MAGDGPGLSMLRSRAKGIPGVKVVGRVDEGEKLRLLARSWFLVHAAHHEGWGISIMEAAAAGTPALAANVPGVRDAIVPNETGVLVDALGPDLEAGLAREWIALAGDRERRDALGRKARERAAQYSWTRLIDRWIDILDEAVMTPRLPQPPGRHPIGPVKRGDGPARRPPASQADQIDAAGAMVSTLPPGRGVRRSMALWQGFRRQFADPDHFYTMLGNDTAAIIDGYHSLAGRYVLDVGGGPGYFAEAFRRYQATSVFVEPFWEEMTPPGRSLGIGVMGDGLALPFGDGIFDVVHSSNVIEHVESPEQLFDELVRVASPGGTVFIAFTNWLSPFGGHETSPWHYLGGERAALRYERRRGYPPKNRFGKSLFPLSIRRVLDLARDHPEVELIDVFPRYYPMWTRPVVAVPGVREVVTWNLALVLQRRGSVKT
jgi:arabinofuranan 3-O-arabinosyltransferase